MSKALQIRLAKLGVFVTFRAVGTSLAAVQELLEGAGYRLARIHGSHYIFLKPGAAGISVPVHKGKVKPVYVRQVEKIIRESSA